jgi:hypothetical protein
MNFQRMAVTGTSSNGDHAIQLDAKSTTIAERFSRTMRAAAAARRSEVGAAAD